MVRNRRSNHDLQAAGAFMTNAQPADFNASWAIVLRPQPDGRTRLVERVRVRFGDPEPGKPWTRYTLPLMGFGVFVMVRRQLLGIRDRVEGTGRGTGTEAELPAAIGS